MAASANHSRVSPENSVRLSAFLLLILFLGRGAAADQLNGIEGAMPRLLRPDQPRRLPSVDPISYEPYRERGVHSGVPSLASASVESEQWCDEPHFDDSSLQPLPYWFDYIRVGYDGGFVIAVDRELELQASDAPFLLQFNGWGQLRHTVLDSHGMNQNLNQFQLKRARIVFSGSAFTPDFQYFVQFDGRSSSGDDLRLLDYYLDYDLGRHVFGWDAGTFAIRTGKYKMPFTMARWLSGREFEFSDRSVASMYFDVNRSLAWGLYGTANCCHTLWHWETALFNGLVTGGAETGSSGSLDDNFAYSARVFAHPTGEWGAGSLADFDWHETLATRIGAAFAHSTINRTGTTEFDSIRVVDSGEQLRLLLNTLPTTVSEYSVNIYAVDASCKYLGWSATIEYYFRNIFNFQGAVLPDLFDHGFWLQFGKFVVEGQLQLLLRWSRVDGNSGTLGANNQSAEELAAGVVWYFRDQHAKFTVDATYLDGAPINSAALDISPGDIGWLFRSQLQFAF